MDLIQQLKGLRLRHRLFGASDGSDSESTFEAMPNTGESCNPTPVKEGLTGRNRESAESDEDSSDAFPAVKAEMREPSPQVTNEAIEDPMDIDAISDSWSDIAESPNQSPHPESHGKSSYGIVPDENDTEEEREKRIGMKTLEYQESSSQPATPLPLGVVHDAKAVQPGEVVDNGMDRNISTIWSSPPYSSSSSGYILSRSNYPPSTYPAHLLPYLVPSSPSQRLTPSTEKNARRQARTLSRYEARWTPSEIIDRAQQRFERTVVLKGREDALLKEACMKSELKRAKKTASARITFQDIDIHNIGDEEDSECEWVLVTQDGEIAAETKAFAGQITIQDRLTAMSQALSEHTKDGTLRTEPGRQSFHVHAAVSDDNELTGVAVVHKTHRQDWASPWTARGYRIREVLDQTEAGTWAIWQALQVTIERIYADRAELKPQDPCYVAVVYSDCQSALQNIGSGSSDGGKVVRKIIAKSMELQRLGVDVHLHWCPGHKNIPGNVLADLVSKKGRQPFN